MASSKPTGGDIKIGSYAINMLDELGRGTFGNVYKGKDEKTGTVVAVKQVQIKDNVSGADGLEEIKKLQKITLHRNVVRLYDFHYHDTCFWMMMDLCELGDINSYMMENDTNMDLRFKFIRESAEALCHMHNQPQPMIHRDIKPGNILLKRENGQPTVKLADFGLSKMVDVTDLVKTAVFKTVAGTPGFMAPEIYMSQPYNLSVDVFALGLVFLAIIQHEKGKDVFPKNSARILTPIGQEMCMMKSMGGEMPDYVNASSSDPPKVKVTKQAAKQMICFDPKDRIPMKKVVEIIGGSAAASGGSEASTGAEMMLSRPHAKPSATGTIPNTSVSKKDDDDDDDDDGLGMALLRQALESGLKDLIQERQHKLSPMDALKCGVKCEKFEIGESVRIDGDLAKAKRLQRGHGGWNEMMAKYLNEIGEVKEKRVIQVAVQFSDGISWGYNPDLLHKVDEKTMKRVGSSSRKVKAMAKFSANDIVKITDDADTFQRLMKEAGLWKDGLRRIAGITGMVHGVDSDGDVVVEIITQEKLYIHYECLSHVSQEGLEVESGDLVYVIKDLALVKRNQQGHGGWNDGMKGLVGRATVVEKVVGGQAILEDEGRIWAFNVKSLKVVAKNRDLMQAVLAKKLEKEDAEPCKIQ